MNGTAWVELLAERDKTLARANLRQAARAVVAAHGYPSPPTQALRDDLCAIGWLAYPAARHGSAETVRKRDWRKRQEAS